jgi:Transglycosylase-like domain
MTPQSPARGVPAPRNLVRRSVTFVVAGILVGGVPLVAHALTDDPTTQAALAAPAPTGWETSRPAPVQPPTPTPPTPTTPTNLPNPPASTVPVESDPPTPDLGADAEPAPGPEVASLVESVPAEPAPVVDVVAAGPSAQQWAALRECEAGGDYSITNPSGKYRGAYQFDRSTWNSVAERHAPALVGVDPAAAAPADQDAMALALYTERGARPWPHCGRHLD